MDRIKKNVDLSLTKTIVTKETRRKIVCPFSCEERLVCDRAIDRHFLQVHQHVLNTAWKNNDFPTIFYWSNFVTSTLRNTILFQLAEKMSGKPEKKLELPLSSVRYADWKARNEELTAPGLKLVVRPGMRGLLNDPRFPLDHAESTCYACQDELPTVQLCPDQPKHGVCATCAIRIVDTWLVKGKYLGRIIQFGEMACLDQTSEDNLVKTVHTPCGICRENVAKDWRQLIKLRWALMKAYPWKLGDYNPREVLEAHRAAQEQELRDQLEAAERIEAEAIWGGLVEDSPLEELNEETDGEYEPSEE